MGYRIKIFDGDILSTVEFKVTQWLKENDIDAINISIAVESWPGKYMHQVKYIILVHY